MRLQTSKSIILILFLLLVVIAGAESAVAVRWTINISRFTDYAYYDGFPSVLQTRDGKMWIVWSKSILGNLTLYYAKSPDLGNTWSEEMNLTEPLTPGNNQNPSIIQAMNGTIWVAWTSDRPPPPPPPLPDFELAASPTSLTIFQGGSDTSTINVTSVNSFSDPVDLSVLNEPSGVNAILNPTQVTPQPDDTATSTLTVSVEATATPGNYILTVRGRSGKMTRTVDIALEITGSGESGGDALTDTLSSSHDVAIEDYEIYYKTSNDDGATWSSDILLTNNNFDDLCPSIVQLQNGTIFMVWQSLESGNQDIYFKTTQDGTVWSDTTQLTTFSGHDRAPSVTQTTDGKIWVTWSTNRTGDNEIYYKIYDGISWSEAARLTYNTDSDLTPSILQTMDGNVWIFWCSMPQTGAADVYYKYSSDNGANWSERIQFTTDDSEDMWPSVAQASDTMMWVTWVTNRDDQPDGNWEVYYRTSIAGDVNEDGAVDIVDLSLVGVAYGSFEDEPQYNPDADIDKDGIIDVWDITIVCVHYGET